MVCQAVFRIRDISKILQEFPFEFTKGRFPFVRLPIERVDQSGEESSFAFPLCGAENPGTVTNFYLSFSPCALSRERYSLRSSSLEKIFMERTPPWVMTSFSRTGLVKAHGA